MSADRWTAWGCWAAVRVPEWNTTIYWKVICKLPVVLTGVCFQKFLIFGYSVLTSILVAKTSTILLVVLQFNTRLDPDGFRVLQICHVLFWDWLLNFFNKEHLSEITLLWLKLFLRVISFSPIVAIWIKMKPCMQLFLLNGVNMKAIVFPQELSYLSAVLQRQKNKPAEEVITLLNETIDAHFSSLKVRWTNGQCNTWSSVIVNKIA